MQYSGYMSERQTDEARKGSIWQRVEVWMVGALVSAGALSMLWYMIHRVVGLFR